MRTLSLPVVLGAILLAGAAAASPSSLLDGYRRQGGKDFSAERGRAFYLQEHTAPDGKVSSCATCHGKDPTTAGKTRANKVILPLSPVANAERFQDEATVEKWFGRNCQDVLQRACTAQEKADFITFLQSPR
jgi:hypothetical protein